jgi:hypothetical protein
VVSTDRYNQQSPDVLIASITGNLQAIPHSLSSQERAVVQTTTPGGRRTAKERHAGGTVKWS